MTREEFKLNQSKMSDLARKYRSGDIKPDEVEQLDFLESKHSDYLQKNSTSWPSMGFGTCAERGLIP